MADCTKPMNEQEENMLADLSAGKMPVIFVLNKIDLLEHKSELVPMIAKLSGKYSFEAIIPVSVIENNGVDIVESEVMKLASESPHFFPDDMITDQPEKVIAAEIVREKLLNLLNDEVPHGIAVTVERMHEREDKDILDVDAVIYCERESHKGIVIGKGGAMLKKAATLSRVRLPSSPGFTWPSCSCSLTLPRRVSIEFRSKQPMKWWRRGWDTTFSISSLLAALLIGVAMGNVTKGIPLDEQGNFTGTFLSLLNPYSVLLGLTTVALFSMHGESTC